MRVSQHGKLNDSNGKPSKIQCPRLSPWSLKVLNNWVQVPVVIVGSPPMFIYFLHEYFGGSISQYLQNPDVEEHALRGHNMCSACLPVSFGFTSTSLPESASAACGVRLRMLYLLWSCKWSNGRRMWTYGWLPPSSQIRSGVQTPSRHVLPDEMNG